jgi:WD40 repeat protein
MGRDGQAAAPPTPPVRTDRYGDPLPPDAVARLGTLRLRHGGQINSLAFSPDGKTLASVGRGGPARLWNVATGAEIHRLHGDYGGLKSIDFSPDGKILVGGGNQLSHRHTYFWDVASGKLLRTLGQPPVGRLIWSTDPTVEVRALALSPDGKALARADRGEHTTSIPGGSMTTYEFVLRLGELTTSRELRCIAAEKGDEGFVCVTYSPDSKSLAAGAMDGTVRLYNPSTGKLVGRLRGPKAVPLSVAFSPDGTSLVAGYTNGRVRVWDRARSKQLLVLRGHREAVRSVLFTPDGKHVLAGSEDRISLWDAATGKEVRRFRGLDGQFHALALSPRGDLLAAGGSDGAIRLWDVATGKAVLPFDGHDGVVVAIAFSPSGDTLGSAGLDGALLWDVRQGKALRKLGTGGVMVRVAYAPGGRVLATADHKKGIELWDVSSGRRLDALGSVKDRTRDVVFTPDGKALVSCHASGLVRVWERPTGRLLTELGRMTKDNNLRPGPLALSPDGALVAIDGAKGTELRRVADGKLVREFGAKHGSASVRAFSPDGKLFASVHTDTHIWDLATGKELYRLKVEWGAIGSVEALAFSADGRTLASAEPGGEVRLWEVATGRERRVLTGHQGGFDRFRALAFSPDGRQLASAGTTVLLWDYRPRSGGFAASTTYTAAPRVFFLRIEVAERKAKPAEDCATKPTHARGASEGGPSLAGARECSGRFRFTKTGRVPRIKVGRGRVL